MQRNTIRDLYPENRPYEKFLAYGPKALTDAELLAIILRTGSAGGSCVDLARDILSREGTQECSIRNILFYELPELMRIRGIGKVKAIQIQAVAELSLRIARGQTKEAPVFNQPEKIAQYYMEQLRREKRECVVLLLLDSACRLLKEHLVSTGTVNASILSSREIFIMALKYEAVSLILLHNHPSGLAEPSQADIQFTKEISLTGRLVGIPLLDHIIIGDQSFYSFRESELLHE